MKCLACGGSLTIGFIPDTNGGQVWSAVWLAGEPSTDKGFWEAVRSAGHGVAVGDARPVAVDAYRCDDCGRLEIYATREPEAGSNWLSKG
jgi:hypothetical protein